MQRRPSMKIRREGHADGRRTRTSLDTEGMLRDPELTLESDRSRQQRGPAARVQEPQRQVDRFLLEVCVSCSAEPARRLSIHERKIERALCRQLALCVDV